MRVPVAHQQTVSVGLLRFHDRGPAYAVIVKLTASFDGELVAPDAIELDRASAIEGAAPGELAWRSDFVPVKGAVDIVLSGHATAPTPVSEVLGRISVGSAFRSFRVASAARSTELPLIASAIRGPAGEPGEPVGPLPRRSPALGDAASLALASESEDLDALLESFQAATPAQRAASIDPGAVVEIIGLTPAHLRASLPSRVPIACAQPIDDDIEMIIEMRCDTVAVDLDRRITTLVFRGRLPVQSLDGREIERISVVLASPRSTMEEALREVGSCAHDLALDFAVEPDALSPGPRDDFEEMILHAARLSTLASAQTPRCRLSLAELAGIQAELAEARDAPAVVLERRRFSELGWMAEERAWAERFAAEGGSALLAEHTVQFAAAQDALAGAEEGSLGVETLERGLRLLESGVALRTVLGELGLRAPVWARLQRRLGRRAA